MADNYQIELTLEEIFGTGISSIEQTTVSTMSGGENVWTVTLTNGNSYDFTVFNGTAGGDPIPVLTASGMTDTSALYLYLGSETGYTFGHWYYYDSAWEDGGAYAAKGETGEDGFSPTATVTKSGTTTTISITDENGTTTAEVEDGVAPQEMIAEEVADWLDENITVTEGVTIDTSLAVAGAAADSKKVGDEISDLKSQITNLESIPSEVKLAMDAMFKNMVAKDDSVYSDEYATIHTWLANVTLSSIDAVFTQGDNQFSEGDSLDDLIPFLTVTGTYSDASTAIITDYELSGSLVEGSSTITVTYENKTDTFTVVVGAAPVPVFEYIPEEDGLLSEFTGVIPSTDNSAKWSESITESGSLCIKGTGTSSNYWQFKIGETPATGKWRMKIYAQIYSVNSSATAAIGLRPQISNGSTGIRMGFAKNTNSKADVKANIGTDIEIIGSASTGNGQWHEIELYMDDSIPQQVIKIDGETLLDTDVMGTSAKNNSVFFVGQCQIYIRYIRLYNR